MGLIAALGAMLADNARLRFWLGLGVIFSIFAMAADHEAGRKLTAKVYQARERVWAAELEKYRPQTPEGAPRR